MDSQTIILISIIVILLVIIIYSTFNYQKREYLTNFPRKFIVKEEFVSKVDKKKDNENSKDNIQNLKHNLIYYKNSNCGLCDKLDLIWEKLLKGDKNSDCNDIINGCRIDNQIVKFKIIDCSKEENNCYNINEFPVFILERHDGKKIKYNGEYNFEDFSSVKQWLKDNLQ